MSAPDPTAAESDDVFWRRMLGDDDPGAPGKDWAAAAFGQPDDDVAERTRVPGVSVHRHDDGSECLWTASDQTWYRMHPLYPLRECDREHEPKCEGLAPFCCGNPSCPAHGLDVR